MGDPATLAEELVGRYTQPLQEQHCSVQTPSTSSAATVLLTGSTGALGSRILGALLRKPVTEVAAVHCLVRAPDAQAARKRICTALRQRKCAPQDADAESRIVALSCLDDATVAELRRAERLVVIHVSQDSAWQLCRFADASRSSLHGLSTSPSASHPSRATVSSVSAPRQASSLLVHSLKHPARSAQGAARNLQLRLAAEPLRVLLLHCQRRRRTEPRQGGGERRLHARGQHRIRAVQVGGRADLPGCRRSHHHRASRPAVRRYRARHLERDGGVATACADGE